MNETSPFYVASTFRRIGAKFIDWLIMMIPSVLFSITGHFRWNPPAVFFAWIPYLISCLIPLSISFYFLKKHAQTPGKMALGLYVMDVTTQATTLSTAQVLKRILSAIILYPLGSFSPAIVALFRTDRRHLLDLISNTQVVQKSPRKNVAQVRPILGPLLLLYFLFARADTIFFSSLSSITLHFDRNGFYMNSPDGMTPSNNQRTPVN